MSDPSPISAYEAAFHRAGERHERIWVFITLVLLTVLTIGTMLYVVLDYELVTRAAPASGSTAGAGAADGAAPAEGVAVRTGPNAYQVYLVGRMWHWAPGPVHVRAGAAITFRVTSADVVHGFAVQGTDINLTAMPGEVGEVTHVFHRPGTYYIICNEYCGLMHHAMVSPIVVEPEAAR